jgi:hypothetical protein
MAFHDTVLYGRLGREQTNHTGRFQTVQDCAFWNYASSHGLTKLARHGCSSSRLRRSCRVLRVSFGDGHAGLRAAVERVLLLSALSTFLGYAANGADSE